MFVDTNQVDLEGFAPSPRRLSRPLAPYARPMNGERSVMNVTGRFALKYLPKLLYYTLRKKISLNAFYAQINSSIVQT
jgi:hypothetical protein